MNIDFSCKVIEKELDGVKMGIHWNLVLAENRWLETQRLILRPVTLADTEDMFAYASDEKTTKYVFLLHKTIEETRANIASYFMAEPLGKYGIELKETGQLIGTIDLRIDPQKRSAELGYVLNQAFWGKGYAAEAGKELLRLGFEELKLIRIFGFHDVKNENSGRVMEKLGMQLEGTSPNARIWKGKIVTDVFRGMTIDMWKEQVDEA